MHLLDQVTMILRRTSRKGNVTAGERPWLGVGMFWVSKLPLPFSNCVTLAND